MMKTKLLLVIIALFSLGAKSQNINFPDANFKAKLLEADVNTNIARDIDGKSIKIDVDNDGEINLSEASAVVGLNIDFASVNSIEGLKSFANLVQFSLYGNPITKIDLIDFPISLKALYVNSNKIASIENLSLATNLQTLDCTSNQLKTIDLSNVNIKKLYCKDNQLSNLSFQDNNIQNLEVLDIYGNNNLLKICKDPTDILPATDILQMVCNTAVEAIDFDPGFKSILIRSSPTDSDPYWHVKDVNGNFINPDLNNDKELTQDEADLIGYINIIQGIDHIDNFETTKGINYLRNLKGISGGISSVNSRTTGVVGSIDIDGLQNLEYINLDRIFVKSINIKNASNLKVIFTGTHHGYSAGTGDFFNFENCPSLVSISAEQSGIKSLSFKNSPSVTTIELTGNNLSSLDVSSLPNLEKLHIGNYGIYHDQGPDEINFPNNGITTLDLTSNTKLKDLDCNKNSLTTLDVLSNTQLTRINCSKNQLASLDVHGLKLTNGDSNPFYPNPSLDCSYNNITNLNINNTEIATLFCNNNQISNLDLSTSTVFNLNCSFNNLSNIDVTNQNALNYLDCQHNNISTLNLDNNSNLYGLICSNNNLKQLKISNKYELNYLNFNDNPSLEYLFMKNGNNDAYLLSFNLNDGISPYRNTNIKYICADDSEVDTLKADLQLWNLNDINVNTYCSFTPGGNFNTITGTVKIDANNNGCDSTDNPFEYLKLKIDDGTNSGETFVQNDGKYEFYTQTGNFNVATLAENPTLFTVSPANFSIIFADNNNNVFTQDICVTANGSQNDAEVVIAPLTNARPGFDAVYNLVWRNKGNTTLSGKVIMNYDSNRMTFQSSSLPYSILSNGSIEFNYTDLKPFANTASEITFKINTPTDSTNPVNMGDVLAFNAQITPTNADITPEDNLFGFNHTVINSFDPNDIVCLEGETVPVSTVGKYLHYVINFENTGNAEAENIVVKMEVDPNEFDINTLQLQNASAAVDTKIVGNQIEFAFKKIKLQSGGHGNVLLKMKSKSDLVEGDTVNNVAEIYFDYNFPIETNDYVTTIYNASDVLAAKINYSASNFSQNNYPINFDASLSTGNITGYQWEFLGNPSISSSTDVKPVVTYNTPGNYTAKLTVFDSNGASSSQTITFSVGGNIADLSTGKNSENNFIAIDADEDDWKGYDINGVEITPKVRQTYTGWSYADIENGRNSQWITLNNLEGYYTYKSREFTIPDNATDAKLNLRSLSFVRNWTYLVKVNPDGSETETEITKTQWMNDGFKGWLNSRSPIVDNYSLSPGRYYIKVFLYSNNNMVRQSIDVNAIVSCSEGLIFANKMVQKEPTLNVENSKNLEVQVYPIPTKGLINIISDEKINAVEVYDAAGRIIQKQIHSAASKESKVNINASKGIYYLKIKTNKGDSIKKIIKE